MLVTALEKPSIISGLGISLWEWELEFLCPQKISVVTPSSLRQHLHWG